MDSNNNNFIVWGSDQIAYGPVELPMLVSWIKMGRVWDETWLFKRKDSAWVRAADLPELKMFFDSKPSAAPSATAAIQPASLRRIKMLAALDETLLASLLNYLEVIQVKQFATVVTKSEIGDALFMVLEGELRARVVIDGRETTLSTIGVGECFGEIALVDHGPRSADVIANQPSVLIKVSSQALSKLFAEAPALAAPFLMGLTRVIAQRARHMTKRFEDSVHFSRTAGGS
jgi:CRP-like cAMP-binding protein